MNLFRIIWDVSGGSLEVPRSNFCQLFIRFLKCSTKCLGRSKMVLGVPRTLLTNIYFPEIFIFEIGGWGETGKSFRVVPCVRTCVRAVWYPGGPAKTVPAKTYAVGFPFSLVSTMTKRIQMKSSEFT